MEEAGPALASYIGAHGLGMVQKESTTVGEGEEGEEGEKHLEDVDEVFHFPTVISQHCQEGDKWSSPLQELR